MMCASRSVILLFVSCFANLDSYSDASSLFKTSSRNVQEPSNEIVTEQNVKMGVVSPHCDNGKWRLNMDWNGAAINYTCFSPKVPILETASQSEHKCVELENYAPKHYCMTERIHYNSTLPTHGDHRPLWPMYGEYKFVPPQRWLHSVEHGAVVMLYNPCAHPAVVDKLRQIVRGCIRKHVITPAELPHDQPLALVTWGCKLLMSHVNTFEVVKFIRNTALNGPEGKYSKQGQYKFGLVHKALAVPGSDYDDSTLCPFAP